MTPPSHASVRILTTGGTLDKVHDWRAEALAFAGAGRSQVPEVLEHARCDWPTVEQLFQVDSLEMTDTHRLLLAERIEAVPEDHVVVTHGTSTMDVTARFLAERALVGEGHRKTVVLTGAMRPYSLFVSDAAFNLGGAVVAAQTLDAGVWAVMNGRVFAAGRVRKDVKRGRFDG